MSDKRTHRGPHPEDHRLFAPATWPMLRQAVADLSWLLSREYAGPSALKLVGDHLQLEDRQRLAVMRCACSDQARARRQAAELAAPALAGATLHLDGYNILTSVEAALAGGVILLGRDGAYRDMASMHGSYRRVSETLPALHRIGRTLAALAVPRCVWYLDSPVSNSGRLKTIMRQVAAEAGWDWQIDVVPSPDHELANLVGAGTPVVTADSAILDRGVAWFNLAREVLAREAPGAGIIDLRGGE